MVTTTALYAGILALISIALAGHVGSTRGGAGVSLGDGGNKALLVAMRRQANFIEYVPLIVAMMAIIELNGAPKLWLNVIGVAIVVARIAHPFGLSADTMRSPLRFIGATLTMLVTLACAVILIWQGLVALKVV